MPIKVTYRKISYKLVNIQLLTKFEPAINGFMSLKTKVFLKLSIYELGLRSNSLFFRVSPFYRKITYKHPVLVWAGVELNFS